MQAKVGAILFIAFLACGISVHAQVTTGTVRGVVKESGRSRTFNGDGSCAISDEARIVGYLAANPNAQYIQTGVGALSNAGRNTLKLPAINNLDFSIFKNFGIGEGSKKDSVACGLLHCFSHPQYVPGSIDGVEPIATKGVSKINTVGQPDFNVASQVFTSHPRVIQLALRFDF